MLGCTISVQEDATIAVYNNECNPKERSIEMNGLNECSECGGRGYCRVRCDRCGGTGYREHYEGDQLVQEFCDKCNGGGEIDIECACRKYSR